MSDTFAEATVAITPKLTGFVKDLDALLTEAMKKVKQPVIRVKPGLTRDFVGDLRRQVDAAVLQAQKGIKPIRIKAIIEPVGVATGRGGVVRGAAAAAGGGGGGGTRTQTGANQALARSLEQVAIAQLHLNRAFDETISLEEQVAAVTKVTTSLDDAQAAAERTLAKAIVAKDVALQKSARRQLADIADFQAAIAPRAAQVQAQLPSGATGPTVDAGAKAAIRRTRGVSDSIKNLVGDLNEADTAFSKLGTATADLAAHEDVLKTRKQALAAVTRLETKATNVDNVVVKQAIANAKTRATAAVQSSQQQVVAIESVVKAEADAARQSERLARAQEASRRRAAQAAARSATAERRRSEQLSRGGQASLLSLAGIRGATLAASRSFLVGAAAITVFARAVKQFADLERNLHVFAATTSATAEQMEAVREEATRLGADLTLPAVSAGDAAGAMVELAKAGLSVQDSIDGARGVLEFATAAAIDNAEAVRLVANVLNAFSLSGKEASVVADTLANAANAAQGSIADIGTAFQQAASAGHQVGLSFQDTATFLTILAKNGIRGSDAGTSLRTALIRLVNPSKKAQEAFEKLGIVLRDAQGNIRPDIFLQIADATEKLGPAQRDATIALIGGQDAFRAVTILGRQSVDSFLAMRAALREEGTAAELAAARTEGLHGAMDGLQSVLETVGTNLARHVGPGLAGFVREASTSITALSENEQVASTLNQTLTATAQSFNLLGRAISATLTVALPLASVLSTIATSIGVSNILAGVVAYKALNAVLDGVIFRLRILRPLFGAIAAARFGEVITRTVLAQRAAAAAAQAPVAGFARLTQVQNQLAASAAAAAPRASALSVTLRGVGQAALVAATSTAALTFGIAAAAAAIVFITTRETSAERATRRLREETDELAHSFDRVEQAARDVASSQRANEQALGGIEQAQINLLNARAALAQSDAPSGSRERRQLILNLKVATQDVTFATQDYKRSLDELAAAQEGQRAAEGAQTKERRDAARALNEAIKSSIRTARDIQDLDPLIFLRKGLTEETAARKGVIGVLREQAQAESLSEQASERAVAVRKRLVALLIEQTKIPLEKLAPDLTKVFTAQNLDAALRVAAVRFGVIGKKAVDAFVKAVGDGLAQGDTLAGAIRDALAKGDQTAFDKGRDWSHKVADGFIAGTSEMGARISAAATVALGSALELALAEAEGASLQAQLAIARRGLAEATNLRKRIQQNFEQARTPEHKEALERALAAEDQARSDVERIQNEIDQVGKDAEQQAKDAQDKANTRAQRIADAITGGRRATALQRRITTAGLTAWLGDDLKTTQAWLNFLKAQKATLVARLKAAGASAELIKKAMQEISDLIFDVSNEVKRINAEIEKNTQERRAAIFDTALQKADLRIRIAEAQDNTAAILKARRARLALITAELVRLKNAGKKNTIAWLELRAEQAEEIAAIRELEGTLKKKTNALASAEFAFLQTLQGFTFNLLGNLIPGFATSGLVGGTAGPGGTATIGGPAGRLSIVEEAAARGVTPAQVAATRGFGRDVSTTLGTAGAGTTKPFSSGQGNTTNHLLKLILAELHKLTRGMDHPEAHHQRKHGTAAMDYSTSGGGPQLAM